MAGDTGPWGAVVAWQLFLCRFTMFLDRNRRTGRWGKLWIPPPQNPRGEHFREPLWNDKIILRKGISISVYVRSFLWKQARRVKTTLPGSVSECPLATIHSSCGPPGSLLWTWVSHSRSWANLVWAHFAFVAYKAFSRNCRSTKTHWSLMACMVLVRRDFRQCFSLNFLWKTE